MASRRGYQTRHQTDQIIVHVARVAKRGGGRRHDGRDELVGLCKGGVLDVQAVCEDLVEGGVVQDDLKKR